eukprot:8346220-Karenia_brevis.AAC.1
MKFEDSAKYLGFILGPGRQDKTWAKPLRKYRERCKEWGRLGCGLHHALAAYGTYAFSTLGFVAQLDSPPASWKENEVKGIQALLPGPRGWVAPSAARGIHLLGIGRRIPDLDITALAAKYRVAKFEDVRHGGLRVDQRVRHMDHMRMTARYRRRQDVWPSWYGKCFLAQMHAAKQHYHRAGYDSLRIRGIIGESRDHKKAWQSICVKLLTPPPLAEFACFCRRKLDRYACTILPGRR